MNKLLSYSQLIIFPTFIERFEYAKLFGVVGQEKFGHLREIEQEFYQTKEWREFHNHIVVRDNGCDLATPGIPIRGRIHVHHLNPLTISDFLNRSSACFDEDNVVSVSFDTHRRITFGMNLPDYICHEYVERRPNDTCPWRKS